MIACAGCGKDMTDKDGDSMHALSLKIFYEKDPDCAKKQMGKYDMKTTYPICFECCLKAFGVKA